MPTWCRYLLGAGCWVLLFFCCLPFFNWLRALRSRLWSDKTTLRVGLVEMSMYSLPSAAVLFERLLFLVSWCRGSKIQMDPGLWMEHAYLRLTANGSIVRGRACMVWYGIYNMIAASQDGNEAPSTVRCSGAGLARPSACWLNTSACK
jgi:hypothetical protein